MKKACVFIALLSAILLTACGATNVKLPNLGTRNVQFGKTMFSIPKDWVEEDMDSDSSFWSQVVAYHEKDEEYTYVLAYDYTDPDREYGPLEKKKELEGDEIEIDGVRYTTVFKETGDAKTKIVNGAQIYRYAFAEEHYKGDEKTPHVVYYQATICIHRDDLHYDLYFYNFEKDSKIWDMVFDSIDVAD